LEKNASFFLQHTYVSILEPSQLLFLKYSETVRILKQTKKSHRVLSIF